MTNTIKYIPKGSGSSGGPTERGTEEEDGVVDVRRSEPLKVRVRS